MNLKNALKLTFAFLALGSSIPVLAGTISYTCDPSVSASTCNYLNTTIAGLYNSTFTNASASIYVQYGTTELATSSSFFNDVSYSSYVAALAANPSKDALQVSALSALSLYDSGSYGSGNVEITDALGTALGFTGLKGTTASGAACSFPSSGCYNAVITITNDPTTPLYYDNMGGPEPSNAYDFYTAIEHQTNEILGTASCISTQNVALADACDFKGEPSAADLFRYLSSGSLVLDSTLSTTPGAYFSYNGGATNGAIGSGGDPLFYNTLSNGDDYGDFLPSSPNCGTNQAVQDAEGCPGKDAGLSILNDGRGEINLLNAVGYDVASSLTTTPTPEPGTISLLGLGLGTLAIYQWRRRGTDEVDV
jgi:hypothetical protein